MLRGRIVSLKQDAEHLHYRATWPKPSASSVTITPPASVPSPSPALGPGNDSGTDHDDTASLLHSYFALSHSLSSLYEQWTASDPNFARRAPAFTGIRILNQDAWETLIAFICSSNNNISRISQMVQKLCTHYGPYVGSIEGEPFHDFPGPEALSGSEVEGHLRQLGFGYRAKYIAETAEIVSAFHRPGWLLRLRNSACAALGDSAIPDDERDSEPATYRAAHDALIQLPGVGPKVADCVCLMGLGWGEAVPVDTHVWQIAQRDYNFGKGSKTKTFTKTMYDAVGDHFRKIWGPQAGWAQSVLFTANLKSFAEQASTKKTEAVVEVTKVEKTAVVKRPRASGQGTDVVEVVKNEKTTALRTSSRTRSMRITTVKQSPDSVQVVEEVQARRTSKRRKTTS